MADPEVTTEDLQGPPRGDVQGTVAEWRRLEAKFGRHQVPQDVSSMFWRVVSGQGQQFVEAVNDLLV